MNCPYCGREMPPVPYRGPKRKTCGRAGCRDKRKAERRLERGWAVDAVGELQARLAVRAEELERLKGMVEVSHG